MSNSTRPDFAVDEIDETKLTQIKIKIIQKHSSYTSSPENDKVLENVIRGYLILENSFKSYMNFCNVYESIQNELVEELSDPVKFINNMEQILRNAVVLVQIYKYIENGQKYSPNDISNQLPFNVRISPLPPLGYTGNGCDDFTNSERRNVPNIQRLQALCYKGNKAMKSSINREEIIENFFNLLNSIPNEVTDKMNELKKRISCLTFSNDLSRITFKYQGKGEKSIPTCILSPMMNLSKKRHTLPRWSQEQWQHFLRNCNTIMKAVPLNDFKASDYDHTPEEKTFWKEILKIGAEKYFTHH